jgi:crotonobetainyl-CoA:carnitine CoA-transferase CaiB-like acyl-CoA transferase
MLDGVVSWLSIHAGAYLGAGQEPRRGEMPLSGAYACYRVYRCADDRWLTVGALEPQFWLALVTALGVPELEHEQYGPPERQREMTEQVQAILETKSRDEWLVELEGLEACVGPVNSLEEAFRDPQIAHRSLLAEVGGAAVGPGSPFRFDGDQLQDARPAPGFGEHTDEMLAEIGVTAEELAALRARGVV